MTTNKVTQEEAIALVLKHEYEGGVKYPEIGLVDYDQFLRTYDIVTTDGCYLVDAKTGVLTTF